MTARLNSAGASSSDTHSWNAIQWQTVESPVHRLQMRIAKSVQEGRHNKAKALQWLLTHSFNAKLLATQRVTPKPRIKNRGCGWCPLPYTPTKDTTGSIIATMSLSFKTVTSYLYPQEKQSNRMSSAFYSNDKRQGNASFASACIRTYSRSDGRSKLSLMDFGQSEEQRMRLNNVFVRFA
jgi:hypothetical protein